MLRPSQSCRGQRLTARARFAPLLLLLSACSGTPRSLGYGLDSQEAPLTGSPSNNDTEPNATEDCTDNPLGPGCPIADGTESCADNPLGPGCPIADGTESCADNPLLPGCPTADGGESCADNPLLPGCPRA